MTQQLTEYYSFQSTYNDGGKFGLLQSLILPKRGQNIEIDTKPQTFVEVI